MSRLYKQLCNIGGAAGRPCGQDSKPSKIVISIHTDAPGSVPWRFLSFADLAIGFSQAPNCGALMAAKQGAAARGGVPMEVYT